MGQLAATSGTLQLVDGSDGLFDFRPVPSFDRRPGTVSPSRSRQVLEAYTRTAGEPRERILRYPFRPAI